jgi:hypothetical protein
VAAKEILKKYSLRHLKVILLKSTSIIVTNKFKNSMWTVANSDPHRTSSWDQMHAYAGGLFSSHI